MINQVDFCNTISRVSKVFLPGDVVFIGESTRNKAKIFSIRMPITGELKVFEISNVMYHNKCLPNHVLELIDYKAHTQAIIDNARDFQAMNEDLSPLNDEERKIFGVRANYPNACFPVGYTGHRHYSPASVDWSL